MSGRCKAGQRADRDGMTVFSIMESVALFVREVRDHSATSHPDHGIHSQPWMFLLSAMKCLQYSDWCALLVTLERSTSSDSPSLSEDIG